MTTREFIRKLRQAPAKRLIFTNGNGARIHGGYHLTELKAASFDTVDCGAQKNHWRETIIQLWVPENEESEEFMSAQKFLAIYDKVAGLIALDQEAEVRFEYGDENFPSSNYHVEEITEDDRDFRVKLRLPHATCKARDRRESGATCCA